jgi:hypothetical protein
MAVRPLPPSAASTSPSVSMWCRTFSRLDFLPIQSHANEADQSPTPTWMHIPAPSLMRKRAQVTVAHNHLPRPAPSQSRPPHVHTPTSCASMHLRWTVGFSPPEPLRRRRRLLRRRSPVCASASVSLASGSNTASGPASPSSSSSSGALAGGLAQQHPQLLFSIIMRPSFTGGHKNRQHSIRNTSRTSRRAGSVPRRRNTPRHIDRWVWRPGLTVALAALGLVGLVHEHQVRVLPVNRHELAVRPEFHHLAALHKRDRVRVADRGQPAVTKTTNSVTLHPREHPFAQHDQSRAPARRPGFICDV